MTTYETFNVQRNSPPLSRDGSPGGLPGAEISLTPRGTALCGNTVTSTSPARRRSGPEHGAPSLTRSPRRRFSFGWSAGAYAIRDFVTRVVTGYLFLMALVRCRRWCPDRCYGFKPCWLGGLSSMLVPSMTRATP